MSVSPHRRRRGGGVQPQRFDAAGVAASQEKDKPRKGAGALVEQPPAWHRELWLTAREARYQDGCGSHCSTRALRCLQAKEEPRMKVTYLREREAMSWRAR